MSATAEVGTVVTHRGLASFTVAEESSFLGRDHERVALANLVTGQQFRAGLLYGVCGVGKTSFLHAALIPELRSRGVVPLLCTDNSAPVESLADELAEATGEAPNEGEAPLLFIARVVGAKEHLFAFLFDDLDQALDDKKVVDDCANLFTRVSSKAAGRARFLFASNRERVHAYAPLERKTGSLFPASNRFELQRMKADLAREALGKSLASHRAEALSEAIIEDLAKRSDVLPADMQIATLAARDLALTSADEFRELGGFQEMERRWLFEAAQATGNERSAERLLSELAEIPAGEELDCKELASRAALEHQFVREALPVLADKGLLQAGDENRYSLAHPVLAPRIQAFSAITRQRAKRAFEVLGSKASRGRRLSVAEFAKVAREGIVPTTEAEKQVLIRTLRFWKVLALAIVLVPTAIMVIGYLSIRDRYYLDTAYGEEGVQSIVIRAGRPGMGLFDWLPSSPSFNSVVVDSGLSRQMVSEEYWKQVQSGELRGSLSEDYAEKISANLSPRLRTLAQYAREEVGAEALAQLVDSEEELAELLFDLQWIARGDEDEAEFVANAVQNSSTLVQAEALSLATKVLSRQEAPAFEQFLAEALVSEKEQLRKIAFANLRTLPAKSTQRLVARALEATPPEPIRRELLALEQQGDIQDSTLAPMLELAEDGTLDVEEESRFHTLVPRAIEEDREAAVTALGRLLSDQASSEVLRIAVLRQVHRAGLSEVELDFGDESVEARPSAEQALLGRIFAQRNSQDALAFSELAPQLSVFQVAALGEIARTQEDKRAELRSTLEPLLLSGKRELRAAAARAYAQTGAGAQVALAKMVSKEFFDVAEAAAMALVEGIDAGIPEGSAIQGIRSLWNKKGKARRAAGRAFAEAARRYPDKVFFSLASGSRANDDAKLHPIAVVGLCHAYSAEHERAAGELHRAALNPNPLVRRIASNCFADFPIDDDASIAHALASRLDPQLVVRHNSANEIVRILKKGTVSEDKLPEVQAAILTALDDSSQDIRVAAIQAVAHLPGTLSEELKAKLQALFTDGDEVTKLVILKTAGSLGLSALVNIGVADQNPRVRSEALQAARHAGTELAVALQSALADSDPGVRRRAIEVLQESHESLGPAEVEAALVSAVRDPDPSNAELAIMVNAKIGSLERISRQIREDLGSRSEATRTRAAAACASLVERDASLVAELLEPLATDASHDVRVAIFVPLAQAWATTYDAEKLGSLAEDSEHYPTRRLLALAALVSQSADKATAKEVLGRLAKGDHPFTAQHAQMSLQISGRPLDALPFLRLFLP